MNLRKFHNLPLDERREYVHVHEWFLGIERAKEERHKQKEVTTESIGYGVAAINFYKNLLRVDLEDSIPEVIMMMEDSEYAHSFYLEVPKDAKFKTYPIAIKVIDDDDDVSDTTSVDLVVKDCVEEKQETLPLSAYDQALQQAEAQVYQPPVQQEIESYDLGSWKTTLLICGAVILLGIILFMIMAVVVKGKKKRKY